MNYEQVIKLIENTPKYNKLDLSFHYNNIHYKIDDEYYKIKLYSNYEKIEFQVNLDCGLKTIRVPMLRYYLTEDKLILKFDSILRSIKKAHYIINKKYEHDIKINKAITKFIKSKFGVVFGSNESDRVDIKFKSKSYRQQNGYYKTSKVDVLKEVIKRFSFEYDITYNFIDIDKNIYECRFSYKNSKLILEYYYKYYKNKDVTNIIRSEKLKTLMYD